MFNQWVIVLKTIGKQTSFTFWSNKHLEITTHFNWRQHLRAFPLPFSVQLNTQCDTLFFWLFVSIEKNDSFLVEMNTWWYFNGSSDILTTIYSVIFWSNIRDLIELDWVRKSWDIYLQKNTTSMTQGQVLFVFIAAIFLTKTTSERNRWYDKV